MSNQDDLGDLIHDCMKIFDENIDILSEMDNSLGSERDDIIPFSNKTELIDMIHEIADCVRIKNAESSFMQRYVEQDS